MPQRAAAQEDSAGLENTFGTEVIPEGAAGQETGHLAEQRIAVATQWQLMWWRFRKHKLAAGGTIVLVAFYLVALFADFFAYADPQESDAQRSLMAPQPIHWIDNGSFKPYVYASAAENPTKHWASSRVTFISWP
jgi:N-terminal TM domain of oligopeptide transport permease C